LNPPPQARGRLRLLSPYGLQRFQDMLGRYRADRLVVEALSVCVEGVTPLLLVLGVAPARLMGRDEFVRVLAERLGLGGGLLLLAFFLAALLDPCLNRVAALPDSLAGHSCKLAGLRQATVSHAAKTHLARPGEALLAVQVDPSLRPALVDHKIKAVAVRVPSGCLQLRDAERCQLLNFTCHPSNPHNIHPNTFRRTVANVNGRWRK